MKSLRPRVKNNQSIETRLFPIKKRSKLLFVSSASAKKYIQSKRVSAKKIISVVKNIASQKKCNVVIHAGWSFKTTKKEPKELIIKLIGQAMTDSLIKTYLAEISGHYYILQSKANRNRVTECLEIQFYSSNKKSMKKITEFIQRLKKIRQKLIAKHSEYPCFLLICGENNIFNKENRENEKPRIEENSRSDRFLSHLWKIQNKKWCILNPSHKPYSGRFIPAISNFHFVASSDKRVGLVITGNNRSKGRPKPALNNPLIWKNGKSKRMKYILEDQKEKIYLAIGKL
ncbi:MAG: hypothetical protein RBG1_1C00001G0064 [candidate division Zixibacteria bacterium RBG-1]|nr:MAG: hypothetical protein RBG1_1C00001G0064 [candidate division Zixibacteria bacterium RBG-1]